jgi:uncharacterized membrane protein HdeD (DUF308 family)
MSVTSALPVAKHSLDWSIAFSILLIIAGILAIGLPMLASLTVSIVIGWLLIFGGVMHLVLAWYMHSAGGAIWQVLLALLYGFTGVWLLMHPVGGMVALTLALAIYLFIEAVFECVLYFAVRTRRGAGWLLFDAIVTLILAFLIWRTWPSSSDWVLGTLVGISMLFSGTARLMFSLGARHAISQIV